MYLVLCSGEDEQISIKEDEAGKNLHYWTKVQTFHFTIFQQIIYDTIDPGLTFCKLMTSQEKSVTLWKDLN